MAKRNDRAAADPSAAAERSPERCAVRDAAAQAAIELIAADQIGTSPSHDKDRP